MLGIADFLYLSVLAFFTIYFSQLLFTILCVLLKIALSMTGFDTNHMSRMLEIFMSSGN